MATVTQLSVRIAAEGEGVSDVTRLLGEADIDIRGFSISDSAEHGVLRLIVDKPVEAKAALERAGLTAWDSQVLVMHLPDHPGGLAGVLKAVGDAGVSIGYVYSLISTYVVMNVSTPDAEQLLEGTEIRLVSEAEIAAGLSS